MGDLYDFFTFLNCPWVKKDLLHFTSYNNFFPSTYWRARYPNFCDLYSNHQCYSISRLGEEFFARSSYDQNFGGVKKYEIWAFQRRIARLSSPPQC